MDVLQERRSENTTLSSHVWAFRLEEHLRVIRELYDSAMNRHHRSRYRMKEEGQVILRSLHELLEAADANQTNSPFTDGSSKSNPDSQWPKAKTDRSDRDLG